MCIKCPGNYGESSLLYRKDRLGIGLDIWHDLFAYI